LATGNLLPVDNQLLIELFGLKQQVAINVLAKTFTISGLSPGGTGRFLKMQTIDRQWQICRKLCFGVLGFRLGILKPLNICE